MKPKFIYKYDDGHNVVSTGKLTIQKSSKSKLVEKIDIRKKTKKEIDTIKKRKPKKVDK